MDVQEVLDHAREAMTVKRVFGDPYEKEGLTVIPAANVMGGAGGGGGTRVGAKPGGTSDEAVGNGGTDSGNGVGYGLRASPAGLYVIKGGEVEWKPALDMNRLTLQLAVVAVVALLIFRSIIRTLLKR